MRVVVSAVARYLAAEPLGPGILLVDSRKLDFGQCQALVVAVELVDFEDVAADRHQIAVFVDQGADGKVEQLARIAAPESPSPHSKRDRPPSSDAPLIVR